MHKLKTLLVMAIVAARLSEAAWAANITAVWANTGEDKVTRDELRSTKKTATVMNRVWNGQKIAIFGARNEVVSFNVILEAGGAAANSVIVSLNKLVGPSGSVIASSPATGNGVFNWTQRPIELFYVRYLQIKGLSAVFYEVYDERHAPKRLQRPWTGQGIGSGGWVDRPDHDKYYPDIAVPLELVPSFTIPAGQNQSIWVDVYIPKNVREGLYHGSFTYQESGGSVLSIPVELNVFNFTLPDVPSAKTMLYYSPANLNQRYLGGDPINPASAAGAKGRLIRDRHFMVAHRHRISLINDRSSDCATSIVDQPCGEWKARLDGSLFTAANGYDGPGVNTGNNVYSIGTYNTWSWRTGTEADMHQHSNAWVNWFTQNAPATEYFLYLADESSDTVQMETWASWILSNPGPGQRLKSLATTRLTTAASSIPSLDIPASTLFTGIPTAWQPLADRYTADARKRFFVYNGHRPATGSFATEDDGVALRELAWAHYKKRINRWFFWESTYYNNFQGNTGQFNVFQTAHTFGYGGLSDPIRGEKGLNYSNGDGVLFYPGTDLVHPADSYGVEGPFASLRLKAWRRGLQDVDYLTMAATVDAGKVQELVNKMVPKVLWEYGVSDPNDPTWVRTDISWSIDPEQWEETRAELAILAAKATAQVPGTNTDPSAVSAAKISPNPWRKDQHAGNPITFSLLPTNSSIKIFTVAGNLVKELSVPAGGSVTWDLTNESGDNIASGLYLYVIKADDHIKRGKLGVIR